MRSHGQIIEELLRRRRLMLRTLAAVCEFMRSGQRLLARERVRYQAGGVTDGEEIMRCFSQLLGLMRQTEKMADVNANPAHKEER